MLHDYQHYLASFWTIIILVLLVVVLLFLRFGRQTKEHHQTFLNTSLPLKSKLTGRFKMGHGASDFDEEIEAHDTVFIVPDISHYTKFIAGNHFSAARSQEIIFSLINAMIEAAADTFELSKLEGDAVLLFADARTHSPERIGERITAIFNAFFEEKQRIMQAGYCGCESCKLIDDLDLKVFVHRGNAARFRFRGSVDHFGADVIILHRLMKNSVDGDRYIMVTEAARESVFLNRKFTENDIEVDVKDVGKIKATVHKIENQPYPTMVVLGITP